MKETYIILRVVHNGAGVPFPGHSAAGSEDEPAPKLVVEVEEIEGQQFSRLAKHPDVRAAAPAIPMRLIAPFDCELTKDPLRDEMAWGVKAVGADTSPFSGDGVVVAVLDTGIDATHPAFTGVELIQKNFTDEPDYDQHGHGTHCAGTILGRNVNGIRVGVAPGVKKALIGKVLSGEGGSSQQIVKAVLWAVDNQAHVISMSLGIDFPGYVDELIGKGFPPKLATSRALEGYRASLQLFERLASLVRARGNVDGTLIVAAAGNESRRNSTPSFEIAVCPPAAAEGMISVAALGPAAKGFQVASFSNTRATVSGPGVDILSASPGGGLKRMSGTSMATPHVAGVAALWAEKLKLGGPVDAMHLMSGIVGGATYDDLEDGWDRVDVGAGLVRAPRQQ